jgi:hypothetical protein
MRRGAKANYYIDKSPYWFMSIPRRNAMTVPMLIAH